MTKIEPQPQRKPRRAAPSGGRGNIAGFLVVIVIAVALFWIVTAIVKHNALQNCLDSGRRDCAEVPASNG